MSSLSLSLSFNLFHILISLKLMLLLVQNLGGFHRLTHDTTIRETFAYYKCPMVQTKCGGVSILVQNDKEAIVIMSFVLMF